MKASIALQVLPLAQGIDRIAVIDQVIAYLQTQEVTMVVTPFETVLEGEFDELMRILKEALEVAGQEGRQCLCQCQNKCRRDFKY